MLRASSGALAGLRGGRTVRKPAVRELPYPSQFNIYVLGQELSPLIVLSFAVS